VGRTAQVVALAKQAATARTRFRAADTEGKRRLLSGLLLNASVEAGSIASYQWKSPFELLVKEPSGAFKNEWWAIIDGLVTLRPTSP